MHIMHILLLNCHHYLDNVGWVSARVSSM